MADEILASVSETVDDVSNIYDDDHDDVDEDDNQNAAQKEVKKADQVIKGESETPVGLCSKGKIRQNEENLKRFKKRESFFGGKQNLNLTF